MEDGNKRKKNRGEKLEKELGDKYPERAKRGLDKFRGLVRKKKPEALKTQEKPIRKKNLRKVQKQPIRKKKLRKAQKKPIRKKKLLIIQTKPLQSKLPKALKTFPIQRNRTKNLLRIFRKKRSLRRAGKTKKSRSWPCSQRKPGSRKKQSSLQRGSDHRNSSLCTRIPKDPTEKTCFV